MLRPLLLVLVCSIALGGAMPRAADAHPHSVPPPIIVVLYILEDGYKINVNLEKRLWRVLTPVPKDGALWDIQRFEDWFHRSCRIEADGEVLRFKGEKMKGLLMMLDPTGPAAPPLGIATLRHPRTEMPKRITIQWLDFEHIKWEEDVQVPVEIRRGMESDAALLEPEEPVLTWHTSEHKARAHLLPAIEDAPPTPKVEHVPGWRLPVLSLGVLLLGIVLALGMRRASIQVRGGFVAGGVALAAMLYSVGGVEIGASEVTLPLEPPSEERAMELFERLHQNIYTAFGVEDEDEIYDRLSVSARGPVLDALYADVYQSLIVREENGAVATVESVETTSRDVQVSKDKPHEFDVVWGWNMIGKVTHWGHMHRRKNVYKASYTVRRHGDVWHIVSMDILEHARENLDPPPEEKR